MPPCVKYKTRGDNMKDYEKMWKELIEKLEEIEEGDEIGPAKIAHQILKMMGSIEAKYSN
jgi:hypothetical protein